MKGKRKTFNQLYDIAINKNVFILLKIKMNTEQKRTK